MSSYWKTRLPFILSGAALAVALWQWFDTGRTLDSQQELLAMRLTQAEQQSRAAQQRALLANDKLRDATSRLADVETRLASTQQQQIELQNLYKQLTQGQGDWLQGEIEHLLNIANQELQLSGNVKTALIALETAASRLDAANQPQYFSLRRALGQDIATLKAEPYLDTTGLSLRLSQLAEEAQQLPLNFDLRHQPAPAAPIRSTPASNRWLQFSQSLWRDIRGLVQIRRIQGEAPVLPPTEAYFVHENLRLHLLSGRLALLQRDAQTYQNDLDIAGQMLDRYFDRKDPAVIDARRQLRTLQRAPIDTPLPDLSASLNALTLLKNERPAQ